jgi:DNA-binding transcriptional MerR regulator
MRLRLFTISEAAALVGRVPATLRTYESKGLVKPVRLATSGDCLYTVENILTLQRIVAARGWRAKNGSNGNGGATAHEAP